jgi:hypothetical protein
VYYYEGILKPDGSNFKTTNFQGLRQVILDKKRSTNPDDLVVVIKPDPQSSFRDVVDVLDEMTINVIERYAMVDIAESEQQLINVTQGQPAGGATPTSATPPAK